MKNLRWQLIIAGIAIAAIALLLLSQRNPDGVVGTTASFGGIYAEGLVGRIGRLNPLLDTYNQVDRDVNRLLYSSLITFDARGNPQPDLAEAWGVSVNGEVYNVSLRADAKWHDGNPVTTADVVFTVDLMRDPEMPIPDDLRALWEEIEVIVFDELNMQFRLPEAFSPFLDYLSFGIVPQHLLIGLSAVEIINDDFNLEPVGSGPYKFEQLIVEDDVITGLVLQTNDEYYLAPPFIEQVVFRYFSSQEAALDAYQQGEILGINQVEGLVLEEALAEPGLNVYSGRLPQLTLILFNLDNSEVSFFQDVEVRQALLEGLNRQKIIAQFLGGQGIMADGPIMPGTWAYYEDTPRVNFNPVEAENKLKAAGYIIPAEGGATRVKENQILSFELVHPDTVLHTAIATAIKENWAELGVAVSLVAVDYVTLQEEYLDSRNYEAALVDLNLTGLPDPDPYPFWHQAEATGGQNYSRWDDRRASEYLERARVSVTIETRQRLYRNFQVHFSREIPAIPLYYLVYSYAVDAQVQGVQMGPIFDPSDRFMYINQWALLLRGPVEAEEVVAPTATP
ncbi:MAG: peptide ABC transporter substrate-binding protein [Chloroflexota bacterium]